MHRSGCLTHLTSYGLCDPYGSRVTGTGTGGKFPTRKKPVPRGGLAGWHGSFSLCCHPRNTLVDLTRRLSFLSVSSMKLLRQDAVGPSLSLPTPHSIIDSEVFSDPDFGRGVHEYIDTPQMDTVATHPGSAHHPSHYPTLHPLATRTFSICVFICVLPTVQMYCNRNCECTGSRG